MNEVEEFLKENAQVLFNLVEDFFVLSTDTIAGMDNVSIDWQAFCKDRMKNYEVLNKFSDMMREYGADYEYKENIDVQQD